MSDPFEYKTQFRLISSADREWEDCVTDLWVEESVAVERFETHVRAEDGYADHLGYRTYEYRIVRRPKKAEEVYLTEHTKNWKKI